MMISCVILASLASAVAAPPPHAVLPQRPARLLEMSIARRDSLASSDTARWMMRLASGEYVEVEVRQHGVDVIVRVIGPDGSARPDVDSPFGSEGTEHVRWIANADGEWIVVIVPFEDGPPGRYEIEWVARRQGTAVDTNRIANDSLIALARSVSDHGTEAYQDGTREGVERAIERWAEAGVLYGRAQDHAGEGLALHAIGFFHGLLGRPDSALAYYSRALPIRHAVGDRVGEATTLAGIGVAHVDLGRPDSALAYYARALPIQQEVGDRGGEATTLGNIGGVHDVLGRPDSALAYFAQALALHQEVGDRPGEAATLHNVGNVLSGVGRPDSALTYYARALPMLREVGNRVGEAMTLNNMGHVHRALGRPDSALAYFALALPITVMVGNPSVEATTLNNIGVVHEILGRPDSALAHYERALPILRAAGNRAVEAATLHNIGNVYDGLGRRDSALSHYGQAILIQREVADRPGEATTLNNIGSVHAGLNHPDSALAYFAQALSMRRTVGDRGGEAVTLSNIGSVHRGLGRSDSALAYYAQALPMHRAVRDRSGEATTLMNIGLLHHRTLQRPQPRTAVAYYDSAVVALAEIARHAGGDQNRLGFAERAADVFPEWSLAWLSVAAEADGRAAMLAALVAAERGRAQAMLDLMRKSAGEAGVPVPAAGADLSAEAEPLIRALARSNSAAVSYLLTPDTLLAWLILPRGEVEVFRTPVAQQILSGEVAALRRGLGADSAAVRGRLALPIGDLEQSGAGVGIGAGIRAASRTAEEAARQLSEWLFPPELRTKLPDSGTLVVVAHGTLNLVPFAVLPLGPAGEPLGLRYGLRYAPSLASLAEAERRPIHSPSRGNALVVGNPRMPTVHSSTGQKVVLGPLVGAENEARWVAQEVGTTVLAGGAATEAEVRARLPGASIVHLASHGYAYGSEARARDSFIALASGSEQDGLLTVGEVLDEIAPLSAELVVLSACQTGLGDLKQAEGTVGLQRAFLAKGARSVLVSLWSVSDEATEQLMRRFYAHWLRGSSKAEALRRAQAEVRGEPGSRFHDPRYWAAFQLVGAD
jgi:tetratricopeptide (TPR) repeat protein